MAKNGIDRRTMLTATTAISAASLLSGRAFAQGSAGPAATLPTRGEFVVRGAHVLSMDDAIGDLPVGDVHVRDGAIVAVAASVPAPLSQRHAQRRAIAGGRHNYDAELGA
jgi:5-methylthioadenosine/S-adenosylhomocysteine deaminase